MKGKYLLLFVLIAQAVVASAQHQEDPGKLVNGQRWLDESGRHINAHGGNIVLHEGTYYWYGEHRPYSGYTTDEGIVVYSSADLLTWKNEGVALAVSSEAGHDLERGCIMERPKVVYNAKSRLFVMLFHLELKGRGYEAARVALAVSERPTGPFRYLRSQRLHAGRWPMDMNEEQQAVARQTRAADWKEWWTAEWRHEVEKGMYLWRDFDGGQMSRDMTVFVDDDGRAYHITSSQENLTLLISELTDDYQDFTGRYVMVAPGGQNEAPCLFKSEGRYWLICSGCTGWAPNEARLFTATSIWGPWQQLPSPFRGRAAGYRDMPAEKTFGGQGTFVMRMNGRHVFMADIWRPRHLSESLHLWLPIAFEPHEQLGKVPLIEWTSSVNEMLKQ